MRAEYVNSFIDASQTVLKSIANINFLPGKIYLKTSSYSGDGIVIIIKLVGDIRGQVALCMNKTVTFKIASAMMMGKKVNELDGMSMSAITEAANIILGNAATILYGKGIKIDITPPVLLTSTDINTMLEPEMKMLCVPLSINSNEIIELGIAAV